MTGSLPTKLVVDVSVVVKWYAREPDSPRAVSLLAAPIDLLAPDLLVAELGNVLWKKVRSGATTLLHARAAASRFVSEHPVTLHDSVPLLGSALSIATQHDRTVYDALYLALATAEGCQVVTADQRLVNALHGTPMAGWIRLL